MRNSFALAAIVVLVACGGSSGTEIGFSPAIESDAGKTINSTPTTTDSGLPVDTVDSGNQITDSGMLADTGSNTEAGVDAAVDSGIDSGGPVTPYVYAPTDINHILITGQSNSVANSANPITTTQPYNNVSFNYGVMLGINCNGTGCIQYQQPTDFQPLVEGDTFFTGGAVETCSSGFANMATKLNAAHRSLVSLHGRSGNTYWCLRKGGCNYKPGYVVAYDQGMKEVEFGKAIAGAKNLSYMVRAVFSIHGESDHYSYSTNTQEFPLAGTDGVPGKIKDYSDALLEWQQDYEAGVKALTNQAAPVPLFISQISGWNDVQVSKVADWQVDAHKRAPGKVILVTPGYHLPFQSDCLHYTSEGQRRLGEYFAKAYVKTVIEGKPWEPVRPKLITYAGNVVTIRFHVPVPPLVLDTIKISNPGDYGFKFTDQAANYITDVAVTGPDTVTLMLSGQVALPAAVSYAQNQIPGTCTGVLGARGNLRDSDLTIGTDGTPLANWGVHFTEKLQ